MCIITSSAIGTAVGIVSAITAVASTALGVTSGITSANQQKAYYEYQANVAKENAKIAESNAGLERQQGIEEARLQRMKMLQNVGSQQAAMAANGVDISQGTPLDVIEDTAAIGELDSLQTRYNYERRAVQYEQQAQNFSNQANMNLISGQNAYSAGRIGAIQTGLAGMSKIGDVASKWYDFSGNTNKDYFINKSQNNGYFIKNARVSGGVYGDSITFA